MWGGDGRISEEWGCEEEDRSIVHGLVFILAYAANITHLFVFFVFFLVYGRVRCLLCRKSLYVLYIDKALQL